MAASIDISDNDSCSELQKEEFDRDMNETGGRANDDDGDKEIQRDADEVVLKMEEQDTDTYDIADDGVTDVASNMKVEVALPKRMKYSEIYAAFRATESDDVMRNVDVLLRNRTLKFSAVVDWILNHKCCPTEYKERAKTKEGRRTTENLLRKSVIMLKKADVRASKNREVDNLKLRLAPFVFKPWTEAQKLSATAQVAQDQRKQRQEAEKTQLRELRLSLMEKEKRLKQLTETKELAPPKEFMNGVKAAMKKKQQSAEYVAGFEKEFRDVESELQFFVKELPAVRKRRKAKMTLVKYYEKQMAGLSVGEPKVVAAESRHADAKDLLAHEQAQLAEVKSDKQLLREEHEQLTFAIDECREAEEAVFDAGEFDQKEFTLITKPPTQKKFLRYRKDVIRLIRELVETGVKGDSLETIFESVFQSIDWSVQGFPSRNDIKIICKEGDKES